jgi:hypothetical protein
MKNVGACLRQHKQSHTLPDFGPGLALQSRSARLLLSLVLVSRHKRIATVGDFYTRNAMLWLGVQLF